jgi:S1-C subfamily serine protease
MMRLHSIRLRRGALAALAGLWASAAGAQAPIAPEELYRTLSPSIWLVRAYDADGLVLQTGSAVVTGPETLLTNCHVLRKAKRLGIANDGVQHGAQLQYLDVERDLCQLTARNLRAPIVQVGDSDRLAVGQKVFALGNPLGLERTLSDGLISGLHRSAASRALLMIQTSAPISPGSSGGGLFDAQGRLIGITTAQTREGQNLNFAIPINWLRDLPTRSAAALRGTTAAAAPTPAPAPVQPAGPAAAGSGELADIDAVPVHAQCKEEYRKYVNAATPKAFAITDKGSCWWQNSRKPNRPEVSADPDPGVRSLALCAHFYGSGCSLYAVDNAVVYRR